jgi:hypothetical protein
VLALYCGCLSVLTDNKEQADKHKKARKQQKTRRKTAQEQNINGKHAECDHVKKKKAVNQKK